MVTLRADAPSRAPVASIAEQRILLIEDDLGDCVLVRACLSEAGMPEDAVTWVRTSADGLASVTADFDCVLLDLGLPDASGFQAVHQLVAAAPEVPVIVLTGRQERDGVDALAAGAQDFLAKDAMSADLLERAIRYAIERHRADRAQLRLSLGAAEQARLERGLLPRPLLHSGALDCSTYYRPGRDGAVLGGDFYDVVELADGTVRAVIGDVMGHGADEAALGVHLRVAWRSLLLAGTDERTVLPTLARLLAAEQADSPRFATVCDLRIGGSTLTARVAGHPAPIVCRPDGAAHYPDLQVGPPLGVSPLHGAEARWPATRLALDPGSSVVLYTDGLLDAYANAGPGGSLGIDELVAAVQACARGGFAPSAWTESLVAGASNESIDDTAAVVLTTRAG